MLIACPWRLQHPIRNLDFAQRHVTSNNPIKQAREVARNFCLHAEAAPQPVNQIDYSLDDWEDAKQLVSSIKDVGGLSLCVSFVGSCSGTCSYLFTGFHLHEAR